MSATDGAALPAGPAEVLAESGSCQVYRCARGCLHVRVGVITLHIGSGEFRRLVETLVDAAVRMELQGVLEPRAWRQ